MVEESGFLRFGLGLGLGLKAESQSESDEIGSSRMTPLRRIRRRVWLSNATEWVWKDFKACMFSS